MEPKNCLPNWEFNSYHPLVGLVFTTQNTKSYGSMEENLKVICDRNKEFQSQSRLICFSYGKVKGISTKRSQSLCHRIEQSLLEYINSKDHLEFLKIFLKYLFTKSVDFNISLVKFR